MMNKKDLVNFIIKESKRLEITAYEYGENIDISMMGAHNILTGKSENPKTSSLEKMRNYIENKVKGDENAKNVINFDSLNEGESNYNSSLEEIIFRRIYKKIKPEIDEINRKLTNLRIDLKNLNDQQIQDIKGKLEKKKSS